MAEFVSRDRLKISFALSPGNSIDEVEADVVEDGICRDDNAVAAHEGHRHTEGGIDVSERAGPCILSE